MRYNYPAIFTNSTAVGDVKVHFPDVPKCYTRAANVVEASKKAEEVLCRTMLYIEKNHLDIPLPSDPQDIEVPPGSYISMITIDTMEYANNLQTKTK